jgi:hypothetical protein
MKIVDVVCQGEVLEHPELLGGSQHGHGFCKLFPKGNIFEPLELPITQWGWWRARAAHFERLEVSFRLRVRWRAKMVFSSVPRYQVNISAD